MQDELIELRGLRFHYRDWPGPTADAPVLVLLHGYTGHARSWDYCAAELSDRYRVLALDQRGHGESAWAPAGHTGAAEMIADLRAFVAALGLRSYTLLGLSLGGVVAFHYAGTAPAELARLIIVDIAPELIAAGSGRIVDSAAAQDVFASKDAAVAHQRAANARAPDAHLRYRVENNLMQLEDGRWTWRHDRQLRDPRNLRMPDAESGWRAVAGIRVPTLLIRGSESDLLSPEVAKRMVGCIPGAEYFEVHGAGHPVPLDAPEAFVAAVRSFLPG